MPSYVFELSHRYNSRGARTDIAACEWNGRPFEAVSRHGATMTLARELVRAGAPDGPWQAGRGGRCDLFGPSLHRLCLLAVHESDEDGPALVAFRSAHLGKGPLEPAEDADTAPPAGVSGVFAPMSGPQVDAILAAAERAGAHLVPVFWHGRVNEVAVWRCGQWFGSLVRNPAGDLLVLDETGERLAVVGSPDAGMAALLRGQGKRAARARAKWNGSPNSARRRGAAIPLPADA